MADFNPQERKEIIAKLKKIFPLNLVEPLGYKRFAIKDITFVRIEGLKYKFEKISHLVDDSGKIISLKNEYNGITSFGKDLAVVWTKKYISTFKKPSRESVEEEKKFGLIDTDGNELLPCIFESINAHLDGFVEIKKEGKIKATTKQILIGGKFSWNKGAPWK